MTRLYLEYLEPKVAHGIVRCGLCGWLIQKGSAWRMGDNGPEHRLCEHEMYPGGPPSGSAGPRVWSQDWGVPVPRLGGRLS